MIIDDYRVFRVKFYLYIYSISIRVYAKNRPKVPYKLKRLTGMFVRMSLETANVSF
jgi:hypothetical protein